MNSNTEKTRCYEHFLENPDCSDCDASIKVSCFSTEPATTNLKLSVEILMEEIKLLVLEKYEFQNRKKKMHISEVSNYQGSLSKIKNHGLSLETCSTNLIFSVEISVKESIL